jgi:hypothetical protein
MAAQEIRDEGDNSDSFTLSGSNVAVTDRALRRMPVLRVALAGHYFQVERDTSTRITWYCRGRRRWAYYRGALWLEDRCRDAFDWAYWHKLIHVAHGDARPMRLRDIRLGHWYPGMRGRGC